MKNDDMETLLGGIDAPKPEGLTHQQELKVTLLRYKRSSRAGFLLLVLPIIFVVTSILKSVPEFSPPFVGDIGKIIRAVDGNPLFTFLIPVIAIGLPCAAMVINLLAFSHFAVVRERKELLITMKYRPMNIAIFLLSFAILAYFFVPDALSF